MICAALDRQHPRDLFDIKLLLGAEGITDSIRRAFIVYLEPRRDSWRLIGLSQAAKADPCSC